MKTDWTAIEPFRVQHPPLTSEAGDTFGLFVFRFGSKLIRVIAVDGLDTGWEHVSVTVSVGRDTRMPTWEEMCFVKKKFWSDEEAVIQFHPPASEYVNNHAHCLHLWKCVGQPFPLPPSILVGSKQLGELVR